MQEIKEDKVDEPVVPASRKWHAPADMMKRIPGQIPVIINCL